MIGGRQTNDVSVRQTLGLMGRLCVLARPHWGTFGRATWLSMTLGLLALITPLLTRSFIDDIYPARDLGLMHVVVIAVLTVTLASSILGAIRTYVAQTISATLSSAMNLLFFNHVQHLPVEFFDDHRVGEVTTRFGEARGTLTALSNTMQALLVNGAYLLLVPPVLFYLNGRLAIIALLAFPITSIISVVTGRIRRRYWRRSAEAVADLGAFQVEVLTNIRTLKTLTVEDLVYQRAQPDT